MNLQKLVKMYNSFLGKTIFETFLKVEFGSDYYETQDPEVAKRGSGIHVGNCVLLVDKFMGLLETEGVMGGNLRQQIQRPCKGWHMHPVMAYYPDGSGHTCLKVEEDTKDGIEQGFLMDFVNDVFFQTTSKTSSLVTSFSMIGYSRSIRRRLGGDGGETFVVYKQYGNHVKEVYHVDVEAYINPDPQEIKDWEQRFIDPSYVTTRALFVRRFVPLSASMHLIPYIEEIYAAGGMGRIRRYSPFGIWSGTVPTYELLDKLLAPQDPDMPIPLFPIQGFHVFDSSTVHSAWAKITNLIKEHGDPTKDIV